MTNNIFSKKLYLQGLKRLRTVGIAATICIILLNVISPITQIVDPSRYVKNISQSQVAPYSILGLIFAPIMVHYIFSYLNSRSQSDFYHAIPETRICVYVSFMSAVVSWITAILLVSGTLNSLMWLIAPKCNLDIILAFKATASYIAATLMMIGFMAFAMMLTGTTVSNIILFIVSSIFLRTVGGMFLACVKAASPVFLSSHSFLKYLSFDYFLPWSLLVDSFSSYASTSILLILYSIIAGFALIAISGLLYKNRRSEIAGNSAPSKRLQSIYRYAITFPFILFIAFSICSDGIESYQILLVALAFLVYTLFELITTKSIKSMVKAIPKILIPTVAGVIFIIGVFITGHAINNTTPQPNEIQSVAILSNEYHYITPSYEDLATDKVSIEDSRITKIVSEALEEYADTGTRDLKKDDFMKYAEVMITLDSGRKIWRSIMFTESEIAKIDSYLMESKEYKLAFTSIPSESEVSSVRIYGEESLSHSQQKELWECFYEEYNTLSESDKIFIKNSEYGDYSNIPEIEVSGYKGIESFSSSYVIFYHLMPRTCSLLRKMT